MEMKEFMDQVQKDVKSLSDQLTAKLAHVDGLIEKANEAARLSAAEEGKKVEQSVKDEIKAESAKIEAIQKQIDALEFAGKFAGKPEQKDYFGEALKSKGFEALKSQSVKSFRTSFDVPFFGRKDTMTPALNWTGAVVPPQYVPGIQFDPDRPGNVRDIMNIQPTSSNAIWYVKEGTLTDGTDMVAPGATKPESEVAHSVETISVTKIGTHLRVATEMLDDLPAFQGYITSRFGKKLKLKEDQQLLYGTGLNNQLVGITGVAQAYVDTLADSDVNRWDVIMAAITQARVDEYMANYVLLHPNDALKMTLTKDDDGGYVFPFFLNGPVRIKNVPVLETTAITEGTFLVGDFAMGAILYDRMQASVEFSREDATNFTTNLVTILFEERLANVVIRPNAFVYGTFNMALASGSA
jgi:HK97 family phage major capsid protein